MISNLFCFFQMSERSFGRHFPSCAALGAVDLASQVVISISEHLMKQKSDHYPIGRARLEALGVIGCACIMRSGLISIFSHIIQFASRDVLLVLSGTSIEYC